MFGTKAKKFVTKIGGRNTEWGLGRGGLFINSSTLVVPLAKLQKLQTPLKGDYCS